MQRVQGRAPGGAPSLLLLPALRVALRGHDDAPAALAIDVVDELLELTLKVAATLRTYCTKTAVSPGARKAPTGLPLT